MARASEPARSGATQVGLGLGATMSPATSAPPTEVVGQRYRLTRRLGAGGMGVVYLAHDSITKRTVVVKVLRSDLSSTDDDSAARLRREAERLATVRHPNIVEFFDFGVDGTSPFIVMEYIVGRRLDEFIAELGVFQIEVFVPVAAQVLKAIGYAHSLSVVIRDIKPENVMLCRRSGKDLFVKVLDFGLARLVGGDGTDRVTRDQLVGTPACISPEEIQGKQLDPRADVYALGVLFYRMLCGRNPFVADSTAALLYKHVHAAPPTFEEQGLADIAPPLEALIMRCLAKDPEHRPADANSVMEALIDAVPTTMFRLPPAGTYDALRRESTSEMHPMSSSELSGPPAESEFDSQMTSERNPAPRRRWPVFFGVGIALLLLLLGWVLLKNEVAGDGHAVGDDPLAEVAQLIGEGQLGAAEHMLDKLDSDGHDRGTDDAASEARAEVLRSRIEVQRALRRGRALALAGDTRGAREAYLYVLESEPENEIATDALRRLRRSSPGLDQDGEVSVDSTPSAELFIDGASLGTTPATTRLALGLHDLRLERGGKTVWSERVEVAAEGLRRSVVLQSTEADPVAASTESPRRRRGRGTRQPDRVPESTPPAPEPVDRGSAKKSESFDRVSRPTPQFEKLEPKDGFEKVTRPKKEDGSARLRPF